jgi:Gram-negative bacterial TonB protein C-terminal
MFLNLKLYSQVDTLLISTYYPDKSTLFETFMINKKDSLKNGSYKRFNPKGKLYIKGFYKNNIRSGIWEFYNKYSGYIELIEKYDYTNNKEIFYRDKNNSKAHFIGGEEFLSDFIYSNKSLDSIKNLNGKILVGFTVDTLGSLKDIKVLRGLHPDIDKLAIKIMNGSPKWIPSIKNGMKIDETLKLPIEIKK